MKTVMFKKILIANRGEIAVRIIRAARELGIATVAVYSEADKDSLHVKLADEAICIGTASSADSYLKIPNIISAAQITGSEAIHPGYGFLAENQRFAEICEKNGIVFIGPKPELISMMGDKATARETAIKHKVPITKGSDGIVPNVEEAKKVIDKLLETIQEDIRSFELPVVEAASFAKGALRAAIGRVGYNVGVSNYERDSNLISTYTLTDLSNEEISKVSLSEGVLRVFARDASDWGRN